MVWVLLSAAALLALAVLAFRHWAFLGRQKRIEEIVADIADARQPKSFSIYESPRFMRLGLRLEKIFVTQETLHRQVTEEQGHLRAILSSMVEGVMVVGPDHSIELANASLLRLFQLREDPVGKTILSALRNLAIDQLVEAAFQTHEPGSSEISQAGRVHLTASAVPIRSTAGVTRGVVVVFHDISRLRQLEEVRREFVANVSHELRTPLSVFQGYLENLIDAPELPREEVAAILDVMQRHSRRLNALLEDLLTLARLESRRDRMEFEPIPVPSFAAELLDDWKLKLDAKTLTTNLDISSELPVLRADRLRLHQVFGNLLDNAIRHTPEGGMITLSAKADAAAMHFSVEDNGVGIPEKDLPHIFERFYRVEKARSRSAGGTGLGLSIVKHIVQSHGGEIEARSTLRRGTRITLHLPLSPPESEERVQCVDGEGS